VTDLVLYDDAVARHFEPFALTRPIGEMRAGAKLMRQRWEFALKMRATGFVSSEHLATFDETDAPPGLTGKIKKGARADGRRVELRRTGGRLRVAA
jgi:hypothetical protein